MSEKENQPIGWQKDENTPLRKMLTADAHFIVNKVLLLRIGRNNKQLGIKIAKKQKREPMYHDGVVDGLEEARRALEQEIGLYWSRVRREAERRV